MAQESGQLPREPLESSGTERRPKVLEIRTLSLRLVWFCTFSPELRLFCKISNQSTLFCANSQWLIVGSGSLLSRVTSVGLSASSQSQGSPGSIHARTIHACCKSDSPLPVQGVDCETYSAAPLFSKLHDKGTSICFTNCCIFWKRM